MLISPVELLMSSFLLLCKKKTKTKNRITNVKRFTAEIDLKGENMLQDAVAHVNKSETHLKNAAESLLMFLL